MGGRLLVSDGHVAPHWDSALDVAPLILPLATDNATGAAP